MGLWGSWKGWGERLDKKLKIIFDFQNMIGGAPRSQLEHMMVMKQAGHDVVATIGDDADLLRHKADGVEVKQVDNFSLKSPMKNFKLIKQWNSIIRSVKPDLIHANRTTQFRFLAVMSDLTGVPLVFCQAGGVASLSNLIPMYGKTPVCYSMENKRTFIKAGFNSNEVNVIANRIPDLKNSKNHQPTHLPIKILFTGNIKTVTVQGLLALLKHIEVIAKQIKVPFLLQIAGQDISPGRVYHEVVARQILATNNALGERGSVEHLGWVEDIERLQASVDICIGKGRSVIQPAMAGIICFVIAETGRLSLVSKENFANLYEFNFSGRGDQKDCGSDFLGILSDISTYAKLKDKADEVAPTVRDAYLADKAKDKLEQAYTQAFKTQSNSPQRFVSIKRFLFIYSTWIKSKLPGITS